jgi:hypothetical protein
LKQGWGTAEMLKTLVTDVVQEERNLPRESLGQPGPRLGGYQVRDPAVRARTPRVLTPRAGGQRPSTPGSVLQELSQRKNRRPQSSTGSHTARHLTQGRAATPRPLGVNTRLN